MVMCVKYEDSHTNILDVFDINIQKNKKNNKYASQIQNISNCVLKLHRHMKSIDTYM